MVKKEVINSIIERFKRLEVNLYPIEYSRKTIYDLVENSICIETGKEYSYMDKDNNVKWIDVVECSIFDSVISDTKRDIISMAKNNERYLCTKEDRLFIGKKDNATFLYLYLEDIKEENHMMCFYS